MNSLKFLQYASTLIFLVSIFSQCFGQPEKAEQDLQVIMKKFDVVGLSVAVVKKGEIIYTRSFGLKDLESSTPLTDQNIF